MKLDIVLAEFVQALRKLLRKPGYFILASVTLALGIATTATVFCLLHQAVLKPLPFARAEQLATLGIARGDGENIGARAFYQALMETPGAVDAAGAVSAYASTATLSNRDIPVVGTMIAANRGFLDTLGVAMAEGRNFNSEEESRNGPPAVILGYGYWKRQFGGDKSAIGKLIQVNGKATPIVGVLPAEFAWPVRFDVLTAMQIDPTNPGTATNEHIVARMRGGDLAGGQFQQHMRDYLGRHRAEIGEEGYEYLNQQTYDAQPLKRLYTSASEFTLWMFLIAAACVLLIAAINLTNLMALRAVVGSHESAIRAALGAPRLRLALPSLAEGLLIGVGGSLIGVFLSWAGLRLLRNAVPPEWLRGAEIEFTWPALVFALLVGLSVALLAAVAGLARGQRGNVVQELVVGGRGGWSRGASLLGRSLVIAQTAIAAALLIVAALFTRSVYELASTPMGFEYRAVTTFSLTANAATYPTLAAVEQQTGRVIERLRQIPGVREVAASTNLPTGSQLNMPSVLADGRTVTTEYRPVTPGFIQAFGIPLRAGRWLGAADTSGAEPVAVVNQAYADAYLGGQGVGALLKSPTNLKEGQRTVRVVGVVGDVRQLGPDQPAPAIVYLPLAQVPDDIWSAIRDFLPLSFAVRSEHEPGNFEGQLRAAIAEVDPQQAISNVQPMQAVVASTTSSQRLNMLLVGLFAGLSLLLAAVGLYAVMSVATVARLHEFGVRAALGAAPSRLLRLVLKDGLVQIAIGLSAGVLIALALSRVIRTFLFGVSPTDPLAIATVLVVLLLAGVAASLPSALRASRVDPIRVLRAD